MCGVIGTISSDLNKNKEFIHNGLKKLRYRGYDSWGVCCINNNDSIIYQKDLGIFDGQSNISGIAMLGHVRWASCGSVKINNAHPIFSDNGEVAVVHNGIIDNYKDLRSELECLGYVFHTDTDTEAAAHLFYDMFNTYKWSAESTFHEALKRIKGQYSFLVIWNKMPDRIFFACDGSPLYVAPGLAGSDLKVFDGYAKEVYNVNRKASGVIEFNKLNFTHYSKSDFPKVIVPQGISVPDSDKKHRMLSEIEEQPQIFASYPNVRYLLQPIDRDLTIFGCGSSYYAGLLGKKYFNEIAKIPTSCEYSIEVFDSPIRSTNYLALSQSGETKDTLLAMQKVKKAGTYQVLFTNSTHSCAIHLADSFIHLGCSPEFSVAATKSFTTQVLSLYQFAGGDPSYYQELADKTENLLADINNIKDLAKKLIKYNHILCLGRDKHYPIALEACLKMKEVSYKHAEAIFATEMAHGPLALIDDNTVSIVIMTEEDKVQIDKMLSNINEIKARGGKVFIICDSETDRFVEDEKVIIPNIKNKYLQPIITAIAFQLLAYYMAVEQGIDPDFPRSLAKCVTV